MAVDGRLYKRNGSHLLLVEHEDTLTSRASELQISTGHSSAASVLRLLERCYYHPTLTLCAQEAVRGCPKCALRVPQALISLSLDLLPPALPFNRWGLDFTRPL